MATSWPAPQWADARGDSCPVIVARGPSVAPDPGAASIRIGDGLRVSRRAKTVQAGVVEREL
jgi:hypothetical protein